MKEYLTSLPWLKKPTSGEKFIVYLAAGSESISAVLVREEQGDQHQVYFISRVLQSAETRYPEIEKIALALVVASRRLNPYFLGHPIVVRTNHPLPATLGRTSVAGRMVKWAVELGQFDISYEPRSTIKAQSLADFLHEATKAKVEGTWLIYVDWSSTRSGAGGGIVLISPEKEELEYAVRFQFKASNNEAEYEALIEGLHLAAKAGARKVQVHSDSQLVTQQLQGKCEIKEKRMRDYVERIRGLEKGFDTFEVIQIPRDENRKADDLAKMGSAMMECRERKVTIFGKG